MAGGRNPFFRQSKMIWNFNTYIPDATEKVARRAIFPGLPAYDVLKISSPDARKICITGTRQGIIVVNITTK